MKGSFTAPMSYSGHLTASIASKARVMTISHTAENMRSHTAHASMRGTGAATRLVVASSVGNALEFYEILVYGYFAVIISKVFFPAANEAVSILVTLGTFGISFLARPVG